MSFFSNPSWLKSDFLVFTRVLDLLCTVIIVSLTCGTGSLVLQALQPETLTHKLIQHRPTYWPLFCFVRAPYWSDNSTVKTLVSKTILASDDNDI